MKKKNPVMLLWKGRRTACCAVMFLCFGSRGSFSPIQLKEIAKGLERSGKRFLWVVKKPPVDVKTKQVHGFDDDFGLRGLLPEGFLERTNDGGKVVKSWASQAAVLKKESVGGFVTRCGSISVLEAVVSGVPLIAWPLYAEQHLNGNVLVKDMVMAIRVEERERGGWVCERGRIGEESEGVDGVGKRESA